MAGTTAPGVTVFVHQDGHTRHVDRIDPAWLAPDSGVLLWVDLGDVDPLVVRHILADVFRFHELSVEDALGSSHHPKVEPYDGYLYLILHGIDVNATEERGFQTHDVDFFIGPNYLVTVHDGTSRSITRVRGLCPQSGRVLGNGPMWLVHRIVDTMVDNYRPEVDELEDRLEALEVSVFDASDQTAIVRHVLALKRDLGTLRRIVLPQRDVVARLARREFAEVSDTLAYGFRDVHDHLVRLADEASSFHDRTSSILDAHLSFVSNRMNEVMKVLTLIATIFMPLTVLTGLWGMNVRLPMIPGGEQGQFWGVVVMMGIITGSMIAYFKYRDWV